MKISFDELIEGPDGEKRPGDTVASWIVNILSTYDSYEGNDGVAIWGILQEIERHKKLEGDEDEVKQDVELLKKYWDRLDIRLDLKMTVNDILDMEG